MIDLDALAEMARNRGFKLVRSRVRTAGKRRFGKVGLTDANGKAVFGMDAKGPNGKPEDAEAFLRKADAQVWGASLDVAAPQRKRTGKPPRQKKTAANDAEPTEGDTEAPKPKRQSKPKPAPEPDRAPRPAIRAAKASDAARLVELIALLGHDVQTAGLRKRLSALAKLGLPQLVATVGKDVVGLAGIHRMTAVHREQPVGRITILVVAEAERNQGLGRMLVEAAEAQLKKSGCGMVEVTSNDRLGSAHAFYRHMGYKRTSIRFMKKL